MKYQVHFSFSQLSSDQHHPDPLKPLEEHKGKPKDLHPMQFPRETQNLSSHSPDFRLLQDSKGANRIRNTPSLLARTTIIIPLQNCGRINPLDSPGQIRSEKSIKPASTGPTATARGDSDLQPRASIPPEAALTAHRTRPTPDALPRRREGASFPPRKNGKSRRSLAPSESGAQPPLADDFTRGQNRNGPHTQTSTTAPPHRTHTEVAAATARSINKCSN